MLQVHPISDGKKHEWFWIVVCPQARNTLNLSHDPSLFLLMATDARVVYIWAALIQFLVPEAWSLQLKSAPKLALV